MRHLSNGVMVLAAAALTAGCTALRDATPVGASAPVAQQEPPVAGQEPAESYIEFMRRAADASGQSRDRMIDDIRQRSKEDALTGRLQLGFLLTSPAETHANTEDGEIILREILAGHSDLHSRVRDLVELRLREVQVRQALHLDLVESKGKIEDLMSIESTIEQKQNAPDTQSR